MNMVFEFIPSDGLNDKFKQIEGIIDKIEKLSIGGVNWKVCFFIIVLVWDIGYILTMVLLTNVGFLFIIIIWRAL